MARSTGITPLAILLGARRSTSITPMAYSKDTNLELLYKNVPIKAAVPLSEIGFLLLENSPKITATTMNARAEVMGRAVILTISVMVRYSRILTLNGDQYPHRYRVATAIK
ncbi:hypothetical protein D3C80_1100760 [compost metagenome]